MKTIEIIQAFPQPDGKILRTIDKDACEQAVENILKGGKKIVREIIDLILEPGNGDDVRPRHALHATAIRVGGTDKKTVRKEFSDALASTLTDDRPLAVKGFIIRQLQICGGQKQAEKIAPFLTNPNEHIYEYAAQALQAIGVETVDIFRKAYPRATGLPRLTILQALGVLEDKKSRDYFLNAVQNKDLEIRLAGMWGLMKITSSKDIGVLLSQSVKEKGWARIKATAYCFELAEKLAEKGQKKEAGKIYRQIKNSRKEKADNYLRESADLGLSLLK
jgi:hypothetical protein